MKGIGRCFLLSIVHSVLLPLPQGTRGQLEASWKITDPAHSSFYNWGPQAQESQGPTWASRDPGLPALRQLLSEAFPSTPYRRRACVARKPAMSTVGTVMGTGRGHRWPGDGKRRGRRFSGLFLLALACWPLSWSCVFFVTISVCSNVLSVHWTFWAQLLGEQGHWSVTAALWRKQALAATSVVIRYCCVSQKKGPSYRRRQFSTVSFRFSLYLVYYSRVANFECQLGSKWTFNPVDSCKKLRTRINCKLS